MTEVLSFATRDMETVSASLRSHISLQKPFGNNGGFTLASDGRLSPSPYTPGSGRKRASTVGTADAGRGMFEPLNVGASSQDCSRDIICLSFILYRQHHQSQVTAENPKLSNPEISKIIGDKWKHESDDVKDNWKKLAEEEKQRHQHQYPNYRYQPRRSTKSQSTWTSTSPTDEHGRCPKCHGRSISTPRTPSTPYSTSPAGNFTLHSQSQPRLRRLDTAALSRRSSFEQSPTSGMPFPRQLPPVRDVEPSEPSSPESKRRRANGAGGYHAIAGSTGAYTTRPPPPPDLGRTLPESTAGLMRHYVGTTLPDLASLPRSQSGPMPPPLRPPASSAWSLDKEPLNRRHSGFDESLRLPPLQTSIPPSPSRSPASEGRHVGIPSTRLNVSPRRKPHSISQETMTMEEPLLSQKLGILSTITRLLPPEGRHGPHCDKRGVFIAVEGNVSKELLEETGLSIEKALAASGDVAVKVWASESDVLETGRGKASGETDGGNDGNAVDGLLTEYFETILSWRRKSKQITRYVTGGRAGGNVQYQDQDKDSKVVQAQSTEACTPRDDGRCSTKASKMPVALVKGGFSLTISDKYASAMAMADRYSAVDHWQWTASFWRGIASPDLVVHVQESRDDANKAGVADISRSMGLLSVRVLAGQGLDEATERRMAFEVMEWMREASFRD
ncbi:HMG box transcription factor [Metarhizium album ARSEF 1941]|uniref:HMG box transcription factor n=1 Tax=Metarhizium album (strain ARSEF 1941) TaxID=1081103 RepID=A0A0B2X088_METAS|nr:HMG box transcription factor [Metarhizium album ARSEF 1941]KHO01947.1 HMG box transcription factor [Metarhizium album ARSEF 1941]